MVFYLCMVASVSWLGLRRVACICSSRGLKMLLSPNVQTENSFEHVNLVGDPQRGSYLVHASALRDGTSCSRIKKGSNEERLQRVKIMFREHVINAGVERGALDARRKTKREGAKMNG